MKIKLSFLCFLSLLLYGASARAVPAMPGLRIVEQPDGTTLTVRMEGDEYFHCYITEDGSLLQMDEDGFLRPASAEEITRKMSRRKAPQTNMGLTSTTYPRFGSPKGLIILVEYSDVGFVLPDAASYFTDMINGENFTQYGATGSALQYFGDQSGGRFTPSFDVLGPVKLPEPRSFYGGNNGSGNDKNAHRMLIDAVEALDAEVDFSQYDTDGDGVIDNVYLFYAGQGEADYGPSESVWPHSWDIRLGGQNITVDGVILAKYACSNEWGKDSPCGIGTFVHEFSHVLGLPDLYNTIYGSSDYTPGAYTVLDRGPYNNSGRTPPNYSAYERNALGWEEPIMLDEAKTVNLEDISSGQFGLIPSAKENEFFLLENRQLKGWDEYIPNHGMLIWHVDYDEAIFQGNRVNNDRYHPYVDIVKANNSVNAPTGYTFPGTSGKTSFTATTVPALATWNGEAIDLPITDISEKKGIITFDVAGGGFKLQAPEPVVENWSEKEGCFLIGWEEVEGATDYILSVFAHDGSQLGSIETGFDGSALPEGWNSSSVSWNATNTNYGENSPSYKFGKDGQILRTPQTDGDIHSLEFWAKGSSAEGSNIEIEGLVNGSWSHIFTYEPQDEIAEYVAVDQAIPVGTRQIRFTMHRNKGSICIDDIVIGYGDKGEVMAGYDEISTTKTSLFKVENLTPGHKYYYLTLKATDGTNFASSSPVYVVIEGEVGDSGVDVISSSFQKPEYYNLQGVRVSNPERGIFIKVTGNKAEKVIIR